VPFMSVGSDGVYAEPAQRDLLPTGELNDFGVRFHTIPSFGRPGALGLGGRFEVGAFPRGVGGYILSSGAVTTNLRMCGTRSDWSRSSSTDGKALKK
jgi:hypothetical protein